MNTVRDFKCNNCGAPLLIPKNSRGHVKCPSCKTECVIEGLVKNAEMAAKENINSGYPLTASSATLHKQLLTFLSESPSLPLDIFEKGEVVREEHYCVPGYLFYCNGTASYTYEAGNVRQHKTAIDLGDKVRIEKEKYLEWTQMSGTASTSANVFASGNRTLASQINELYMFLAPKNLVDYEELEFPHDVVTYDYNLPQAAAFNEHIRPYIEGLLEERTRQTLAGKATRDLSMGGSRIDKDEIIRVYLGLYRVVFKYGGKEYAIWVTGKGEKVISEDIPADSERQKALVEKQKAKETAVATVTAPKTGWYAFSMVIFILFGAFSFFKGMLQLIMKVGVSVGTGLGLLLSILGVIIFVVLRSKARIKFAREKADVGAPFQKDIDSFIAQPKQVLEQFKNKRKGMRGIYQAEVTGDASAF